MNLSEALATGGDTIIARLAYWATHQPDKVAYTFLTETDSGGQEITYEQLFNKSQAIAHYLRNQGIESGQRVLLLYSPGLDFLPAFLGCLAAGIIAVPAYPPRNARHMPRIEAIVKNAEARAALTSQALAEKITAWLNPQESPTNAHTLEVIATDSEAIQLSSELPAFPLPNPGALAFLQYTSGSTASPKGVMVTHDNIVYNEAMLTEVTHLNQESTWLSWLPVFHDMGLIAGMLHPLYLGAHCVFMSPTAFIQKPIRWLEAITQYRPEKTGGPNFAFELCLQKIKPEDKARLDLSSLKSLFNGSEPIRVEVMQDFAKEFAECGFKPEMFFPCYGMAESTLIASGNPVCTAPFYTAFKAEDLENNLASPSESESEKSIHLMGCGRAILEDTIVIADPQSSDRLDDNRVGEIWIQGRHIASGYWNNPEATQSTFQAFTRNTQEGPFLRTGDLGFFHQGQLYICGRLKDLIIIHGRNVYPQDIEACAQTAYEGLRPSSGAAFATQVQGEEKLVVVQEVEREFLKKLDYSAACLAMRQAIAKEHEIEVHAIRLISPGTLAKTSSGKIQRKQCALNFENDDLKIVGHWTQPTSANESSTLTQNENSLKPQPEIIAWLRKAIATHASISIDSIDIKTPFADYAFDSTKLIELSGELSEWLGQEVSPTLLFDHPSISALTEHLSPSDKTKQGPEHSSTNSELIDNDIAVVGMACRFPGASSNLNAFWDLLTQGKDAITEIPKDRWNWQDYYNEGEPHTGKTTTRFGAFLDNVDQFEPEFFGISPREARNLDPQQRLLLEVTWEALENAAINPERLRGSASGVYVGISNNDYASLALRSDPNLIDTNTGTGNALSAAAGRLAYTLGWQGPALAIDTACSSSLVAVHQACQSLLNGESTFALAAGVNLILTPELTITFSQSQMMASDGRCKTFDDAANGYVRGEGCGVVLLKKLSDAVRDQDNIIAVVKGSAVNQDGASNGLTAPNGQAQERVLEQALNAANLSPTDLQYIETHGTGTSLGDPIEVKALARALHRNEANQPPLHLGSVKTNIGHLEAAAGIAGFIKAALSLNKGVIPQSLHFNQPNRHIPWEQLAVKVNDKTQAWPTVKERQRYAGVSSFGFTGTNAHVILGEAPEVQPDEATLSQGPNLFCLSARSDEALKQQAQYVAQHLSESDESLNAIAQTLACGRSHFEKRLALVAGNKEALIQSLHAFGKDTKSVDVSSHANSKVCFLFTGQGSQYKKMAQDLYRHQPIFKKHFDHCNALIEPLLENNLIDVIYSESLDDALLNQTQYTQPALFAIEYSLAQLWLAWGIEPQAVAGHSLGEYVAACISGVFSLEDGITLVAHRARLMQALPQNGAMVAVFASEQTLKRYIEPFQAQLGIASTNAPEETVLSGQAETMQRLQEQLEANHINCFPLRVSHAFHSPLMKPMLDKFEKQLNNVSFQPPSIPLISNITGQPIATNSIVDPAYWLKHILEPVRFTSMVQWLKDNHFNTFLEMGPKPLLTALAQKTWPENNALWVSSLKPKQDDITQTLNALGQLYQNGASIDWKKVFTQKYKLTSPLPNYPFQRKRYWLPTSTTSQSFAAPTSQTHPLLGNPLPPLAGAFEQEAWAQSIDVNTLTDYSIQGQPALPASWFVNTAMAAIDASKQFDTSSVTLASMDFQHYIFDPAHASNSVQIQTQLIHNHPNRQPEVCFYIQTENEATWERIASTQLNIRSQALPANENEIQSERAMQFGVMFFNGTESSTPSDNYKLLLESTRFADQHGFSSVWVPERHYTEFGGLYPNPVVVLSGLARETQNIRLMAGSLVMPLHHPLRVAEDWALVDNLSDGRVGLSFASGWNPNDFAIAPENYAERHQKLFEGLETVRKLWRGETISAKSGDGRDIEVRTYPTPIQKELPFWVTAAGNPKTFYKAGAAGANLLTHLLDQGPEELAEKLKEYRKGRADHGLDPDAGIVSIMIHTFVGPDNETVREIVREPYCDFLQENLHLLKGLATSRGGDVDIDALSDTDKAEFVGFLFERFYAERALMGTPEKCQTLVNALADAGVNEIACLLDFGPPTDKVIASLPYLHQLKLKFRTFRKLDQAADSLPEETLALDTIRESLPMELSAQRFYLQLQHRGVAMAPSQQYLETFWRKEGQALSVLKPDNDSNLIEACLQTFACAIPDESFAQGGGRLYHPKSFEAWQTDLSEAKPTHCYAHIHTDNDQTSTTYYSGDVILSDASGKIVAQLKGLRFEPKASLSQEASIDTLSDRFYQVQWMPQERNSAALPHAQPIKHWLVLSHQNNYAPKLTLQFEEKGYTVFSVESFEALRDVDAFGKYLADLPIETNTPLGILVLGSIKLEPKQETLEYALRNECASMLHLVQALEARNQAAKIFAITQQAQPVIDSTPLNGLVSAPLWGLGKVIALEYPELWGGLIDFNTFSDETFAQAIEECLQPDGEDQIAYRDGQRYVSRLQRSEKPAPATWQLKADALYLITGGLGGIGRKLAQFLVDRGARHLCLIGLHALPPRETWTADSSSFSAEEQTRIAAIQQLESQGVQVHLLEADVANTKQMEKAFQAIDNLPQSLCGVFHLAGKPEIRSIADTRFEIHRDILDPKIAGTWNLHTLTEHLELDYFVCYSSISGTWGSAGQPFYSAANHFMDVFAAYRSQLGKPTTSINWGPWSEGGMLSEDDKSLLASMGIWGFSQEEALSALEMLSQPQVINQVAVKIDWRIFKDLFETKGRRPLLDAMTLEAESAEAGEETSQQLTDLAQNLAQQTGAEAQSNIGTLIIEKLAGVLGYDDANTVPRDRGFFEMGLDSLMAIELKNRLQSELGLTLKTTAAFNYPNPQALGAYLIEQIQNTTAIAVPNNDRQTTPIVPSAADDENAIVAELEAQVENLSDEELLDLLEKELE